MDFYKNISLNNLQQNIDGVLYNEEWMPIPEWEDLYQISNFGRVKGLNRYVPHYKGGLALIKEKIIKLNERRGYVGAHLYRNSLDNKVYCVHRLVADAFISNIYNKPTVNHIDGNKKNNFYKNLEWASRSEQQIHAMKNGLKNKSIGSMSNFSKLNKETVLQIKKLHKDCNKSVIELSEMFNTCRSNVRYIINGQTWKYV